MSVRILDLQLIYGVAGAREQFEKLVAALVESEEDSARRMEVSQGDGGIDIYVGDWSQPIDVYQAKFFPNELGDPQKNQIRSSFRRCESDNRFSCKTWTLCLPRDMTVEETSWFDGWATKQTRITIQKPWTASKLEHLLLQAENSGVRESFFKQEHLAQVRETHTIVQQLASDFEQRIPAQKPLTFTPLIDRLEPLRIADLEGQRILCLKLHLFAENQSSSAIPKWSIKVSYSGPNVERYLVTSKEFPAVGSGPGYWQPDPTILPTLRGTAYTSFGVRLDGPMPPVRRLFAALEGLTVTLTPVTENNLGDAVTYVMFEHIDRTKLQAAMDKLSS